MKTLVLLVSAALVPLLAQADDDALTPQKPLTRAVGDSVVDALAPQARNIGQHPTPPRAPAKDSPSDDYKYLGDMKDLTALKRNGDTTIWADSGEGTAASPKHFYLTWVGTDGRQTPLLVFTQPSDGEHPEPPQDLNMTTRQPVWLQGHPGPVQVWRYPEKTSTQKGLYAYVAVDPGASEPKLLQPILWWGLPQGQELDQLDPKDGPQKVKEWFGSKKAD